MSFHSIRNISSPEDLENNRKIYSGQALVSSILDLPTDENVRDYLVEAIGKVRKRPTAVHRAIRETLLNNPEDFTVLNSGIVIVAKDLNIDEKEKQVNLSSPSIINGAQTQGVMNDLKREGKLPNVHIKFEIIVTSDDSLIAETSIARNFQNDVMTISIAGRLGQLDELERSISRGIKDMSLRKSESEWPSDEFIDTEKLLQVITALIPNELWHKGDIESINKVYTYSAKAKCLKDFQDIYVKAKNVEDSDHTKAALLYKFFIDIAPQAWELYLRWKSHQGFRGTRLREIEREGQEITDVPDGIVFPIIASFAEFVKKTKTGWRIQPPSLFKDEELIKAAKSVYMQIANSDPQRMGKTRACYSALSQITSIYQKFSQS